MMLEHEAGFVKGCCVRSVFGQANGTSACVRKTSTYGDDRRVRVGIAAHLKRWSCRHLDFMEMACARREDRRGALGQRNHRSVCLWTRSCACVVVLAVGLGLTSPQNSSAVGLQNGKLPECQADHNCVSSTSIRNPSKFSPPWTYLSQTSNPSSAWKTLLAELETRSDATIVTANDRYIHATFPSRPKGIDDVEFVLLPDDDLVAYKSNSREVIYVYPLTQPIGDFGNNKKRFVSDSHVPSLSSFSISVRALRC